VWALRWLGKGNNVVAKDRREMKAGGNQESGRSGKWKGTKVDERALKGMALKKRMAQYAAHMSSLIESDDPTLCIHTITNTDTLYPYVTWKFSTSNSLNLLATIQGCMFSHVVPH
jgi:hypothetical protein